MSFFGGVLSAFGAVRAGQAQQASAQAAANAARFNAQVAVQNAELANRAAADKAEQRRKRLKFQLGNIRAGFAKGGVTMEGSPLLAQLDQIAEASEDINKTLFEGELRARGFETQTTLFEQEAAAQEVAGKAARNAGLIQGGSTLITTIGKSAGQFGGGA
jgi:hypothetical protein